MKQAPTASLLPSLRAVSGFGRPDATDVQALTSRWQSMLEAAPDAVVLEAVERSFTRAAFEQVIGRALQTLRSGKVEAGDVVAWLGANTPQMLAMLFACARHGAIFLPLNWRLARAELAAVLQHAGAACLLGTDDMASEIAELQAALPGRPADSPTLPDDVLLVYTSGTTGRPKGALHTQAGLVANADAAIAVQGLDAGTRALSVLPLFHVGGLCIQTVPALLAGGVVRLHARFDAAAWLLDAAHWRPTTGLLVPATMAMLIAHPAWSGADLSSLRFVNSGSSVVPLSLIQAFHARGVPVAQVYGATETGPFSIALPPAEAMALAGRAGWPAPGVEVKLLDAAGRAVAPGQVGEIAVRGPNAMRAYHREPHSGLRDGWFHTGDLARRDANGCYTVVGRSKDMIISGGENVYPAEIENLLVGWPGLADCAVVGLPDARWGEVPVLALVPAPGAVIDEAQVLALLRDRLARYKLPRHTVQRDALPKTALGKVQKERLVAELMASMAAVSPPPHG